MSLYRSVLFPVVLALAAFVFFGSPSVLAQKPCAGLHCATVRVDHVSKPGKEGGFEYITVSGKAGTYILSCFGLDCPVPIEGKEYEYSEDEDRSPFLTGPGVHHEGYSLEVIVPESPCVRSPEPDWPVPEAGKEACVNMILMGQIVHYIAVISAYKLLERFARNGSCRIRASGFLHRQLSSDPFSTVNFAGECVRVETNSLK